MILFGIGSCDTCRKARAWLDARAVEFRFHDLRVDGLDRERLTRWADTVGWEALLNRRSATWRQLPQADRSDPGRERALALMLAHPTLIKRPVLEADGRVLVGFREADYEALV